MAVGFENNNFDFFQFNALTLILEVASGIQYSVNKCLVDKINIEKAFLMRDLKKHYLYVLKIWTVKRIREHRE